jgi:heme/copper-type cytochrome/quinol oxidase subunit 2
VTMKPMIRCALALIAPLMMATAVHAAEYVITLKDQQFTPSDLVIPAGQKVQITVKNADARAAEFESHDLNREKIIAAGGQVKLFVGPVNAGTYTYFDEFNAEKAKGTITAK